MESSGQNQVTSPVNSSTWFISAAEACHEKYLTGVPDSGFHSCATDQNCLNESQVSHEDLADKSALGENSLETIKPCEDSLPGCPSEGDEVPLDHEKRSRESFDSEQDSGLLQQYLESVEQLDDADKTSCSNETESSRPQTAVFPKSQEVSCSAMLGSQDAQDIIDQAPERCNLDAEGQQNDDDSSIQALSVSITV